MEILLTMELKEEQPGSIIEEIKHLVKNHGIEKLFC